MRRIYENWIFSEFSTPLCIADVWENGFPNFLLKILTLKKLTSIQNFAQIIYHEYRSSLRTRLLILICSILMGVDSLMEHFQI